MCALFRRLKPIKADLRQGINTSPEETSVLVRSQFRDETIQSDLRN
jgi:hypothetical protein